MHLYKVQKRHDHLGPVIFERYNRKKKRQKTMRTFRFLPIVRVWTFKIRILNFDHSRFDKIRDMC